MKSTAISCSKFVAGMIVLLSLSACGGSSTQGGTANGNAAATGTTSGAGDAAATGAGTDSTAATPATPTATPTDTVAATPTDTVAATPTDTVAATPTATTAGTDSTVSTDSTVTAAKPVTSATTLSMLHTSGRNIVNASGAVVQLKGFNLGGWFVMESFMSPMDAGGLTDTYSVMMKLNERFGTTRQRSLMKTYQESWINENDLDNIKNAGFNAVRVPVWWGQFFALDNPTVSGWRDDAFERLDWLVAAAGARGIYVIIDMHGVIGGQNMQATTGREERNMYWTRDDYKSNTAWMWWQIANHYKGNATVAGYDLMNEPMGATEEGRLGKDDVWPAYNSLYTSVRQADPGHMIFVEGTYGSWNWSMLPAPSKYGWTNIVYEMHEYQNFGTQAQVKAGSDKQVTDFNNHADWNVPGYIGEFNDFNTGAAQWQDSITAYNKAGLSWTMWSYKSVNGVAPNPWGWYDPVRWPQRPDVSKDTAEEIARKWALWKTSDTFGVNSALAVKPKY